MSVSNPETTPQRQRQPFAATAQLVLIVLLLVSFVLIAQQFNKSIYALGMNALIFFTLLQIAFGNIPSHFNFRQSMAGLAVAALIIGGIVILSIYLVPSLLMLGR
jgi:hypothetical protein